jgi:hypothetical protein
MGRNAYRVIEVKQEFSFSVSSHPDLGELLVRNSCHESLNSDGAGTVEIEVDLLEEILSELVNPDKELVAAIEKDLRWARKHNKDVLTYNIF